ncbi:MAG: response regulator transcription factor [Clostridia bacterium]|nr:response regulator transcription factor [Clostridia bacterium]
MAERILVVDDERPIADILRFHLERSGYEVVVAYNGEDAIALTQRERFDLVLLDLMLPRVDGFSVCREIRSRSGVPILMLTARQDEQDVVQGLELGADDYVTKPFSARELLARVRALLRRASANGNEVLPTTPIVYGDLTVDLHSREVRKGGKPVELTVREFELLKYLLLRQGQLFKREVLLEEVWGYEYLGDIRTVDVTVRRLREKIEDNPSAPRYLITKRGVGYMLRKL